MALTYTSPLPSDGFSLTLPDSSTLVEADPAPYSNTKEIVVLNTNADGRVFLKWVILDSGGALPAAGSVTATNSTIIPASGSISLCIGTEGYRNPAGTVAWWAANAGSKLVLVFKSETETDVVINVTYVQGPGGSNGCC